MVQFWGDFNSKQTQAITAPLEHLIINAAAGTGKTSTLAARILYMQTEMDIPPGSIMAISFSRTARARLLTKVTDFCKRLQMGSPVKVFTFHGLAYRILRMAIGYGETSLKPQFEVLGTDIDGNRLFHNNKKTLLQGLAKSLDVENATLAFLKVINELRQGSDEIEPIFTPEELDPNCLIEIDIGLNMNIRVTSNDVKTVWRRYELLLKQNNCIDYNGLITEAIRILSHEDGETTKRISESLKVILVDEYQDTSKAQNSLLLNLAGQDIPINVVGDTDQTIYTFNGSSVSNMERFSQNVSQSNIKMHPPIYMVENYRSTPAILEVANHIRNSTASEHFLMPAHDLNETQLLSFRLKNIPVRLIHAPRCELAADYVAREIQKLILEDGLQEHEIAVLIRKNSEYAPQGDNVVNALEKFGLNHISLTEKTDNLHRNQLMFVYDFCQDSENYGKLLLDILRNGPGIPLPDFLPIEKFESYLKEAHDAGAIYCYEAVDMLYDNLNDDENPVVNSGIQIRTVHSAKGEEFRVVFLMYLGDRSFPHGSNPNVDEERRLLYVGITRAQERLYILGRPGIHYPDFLGDCKSSNSIMETHMVSVSKSDVIETEQMDSASILLVKQAKEKQLLEEEEERKRLWKHFEED